MIIILKKYKGLGVFGPAYKVLLENDPHHPDSVDMVLMKNMILLCKETREFLYTEYTPLNILYKRGSRPKLEKYVELTTAKSKSTEDKIKSICRFVHELQEKVAEIQVGGTEEQIIERGSEWCTELARVACVLYQIAGFPARIVYLADVERAYSGHAIVEIYWKDWGIWCAVDQSSDVVYLHSNGKPASVWELMHNPKLIQRYSDESLPYVNPFQFRKAAISNYFVWEWKKYSYQITKINEYYRSILNMSDKGWPGGLRWLHGEDQSM